MGLNVLGPRKTRSVARATGLEVIHAVVQSHGDAGRAAWFTTADHVHGVLDRHTGEWKLGERQPDDPEQWTCRQSSCHALFGPDGELVYAAEPDPLCPHGFPPEFCGNCHEEDPPRGPD